MDALVNATIAIGLLLLLVLVIYLIDKVNALEKQTRQVMSTFTEKASRPADPFMGLSSKKLWDVMTGRSASGSNPVDLENLRQLYQLILSRHIEALYQEGFKDGQRGMSGEPKNTRLITTAKGQVESWMPSAQANTLYQCGLKAAQTPSTEWGAIRANLDEAGLFLLTKTQLDASNRLSDWLMPNLTEAADTGPKVDLPSPESAATVTKTSPP